MPNQRSTEESELVVEARRSPWRLLPQPQSRQQDYRPHRGQSSIYTGTDPTGEVQTQGMARERAGLSFRVLKAMGWEVGLGRESCIQIENPNAKNTTAPQ